MYNTFLYPCSSLKLCSILNCFYSEAVAQRSSAKKVLLEISQNSWENTCARVSFLINLQVWWLLLVAAGCWCFWGPASGGLFYTPSTPLVAAPVYYEQAFSHHAPGLLEREWTKETEYAGGSKSVPCRGLMEWNRSLLSFLLKNMQSLG